MEVRTTVAAASANIAWDPRKHAIHTGGSVSGMNRNSVVRVRPLKSSQRSSKQSELPANEASKACHLLHWLAPARAAQHRQWTLLERVVHVRLMQTLNCERVHSVEQHAQPMTMFHAPKHGRNAVMGRDLSG
eukprot:6187018-Pleurochrysis_carterae.AAC.2